VLTALAFMHLIALHQNASNNPMGVSSKLDRVPFYPYYVFKDLVGFFAFFLILSIFVFFFPNALGHPDNAIPANPMQTPISIVPEFYLLPFYAILRAIPNKLLGVVAMLASILILFLLPYLETSRVRSSAFRPLMRLFFWLFVMNFLLLIWIGANHPEPPFIHLGQICSGFYFSYFLIFVPLIGLIENSFADLATFRTSKNTPPKTLLCLLLASFPGLALRPPALEPYAPDSRLGLKGPGDRMGRIWLPWVPQGLALGSAGTKPHFRPKEPLVQGEA
jgi:ubiquinol-cytochrome c reductase cytochrome b subunit